MGSHLLSDKVNSSPDHKHTRFPPMICGKHFLAIKLDFNRGFVAWHEFGSWNIETV
jgi:hypothetical protein